MHPDRSILAAFLYFHWDSESGIWKGHTARFGGEIVRAVTGGSKSASCMLTDQPWSLFVGIVVGISVGKWAKTDDHQVKV